jgi:hypothetical protein
VFIRVISGKGLARCRMPHPSRFWFCEGSDMTMRPPQEQTQSRGRLCHHVHRDKTHSPCHLERFVSGHGLQPCQSGNERFHFLAAAGRSAAQRSDRKVSAAKADSFLHLSARPKSGPDASLAEGALLCDLGRPPDAHQCSSVSSVVRFFAAASAAALCRKICGPGIFALGPQAG